MVRQSLLAALVIAVIGWSNGLPGQQGDPREEKAGHKVKAAEPPPLPAFPTDVKWPKETKENLDEAMAVYPKDQVSAYLAFKRLLDREKDKPTPQQRDWLQKAADISRERAVTALKRDFDTAADGIDLHAMQLVMLVADKVQLESLPEMKATFDKTKTQVITGKKVGAPLWKVTRIKGELLDNFSEGNINRVTLGPKEGGKLLRVKASVENVSETSDVPYAVAALHFGELNSGKKDIRGPSHIIQDSFIVLLAGDGNWIPCLYVCESCKPLRGFAAYYEDTESGRDAVVCSGTYVPKGNSVDLDVVFSVPKGLGKPCLLVLGSVPAP